VAASRQSGALAALRRRRGGGERTLFGRVQLYFSAQHKFVQDDKKGRDG
jgi:hypothetical protein